LEELKGLGNGFLDLFGSPLYVVQQTHFINETLDFLSPILEYPGVLDIVKTERYKGISTLSVKSTPKK
jgi:hypothetical protein